MGRIMLDFFHAKGRASKRLGAGMGGGLRWARGLKQCESAYLGAATSGKAEESQRRRSFGPKGMADPMREGFYIPLAQSPGGLLFLSVLLHHDEVTA